MKVERNNRHVMKWKLCIHKLLLFVSACILTLYAVIEKCINCNLKLLTCGGQNMSKSKKKIYILNLGENQIVLIKRDTFPKIVAH